MSFPGTGQIWMNGKLVDWKDATIHIASHVIHYGSGVFEGARCYATPNGSACFRLDEHLVRLVDSAKIYRMAYDGLDLAGWREAVLQTIRANRMKACYIRPIIYRGYDTLGVNPLNNPVDAAIMVWEWGAYLGAGALEQGVDVKVSSWARMAPNTLPALAKSVANYANSQLIKMEALADGYSEGIALDVSGNISEGSGQNIFIVRNGVIYTPPLASSVLGGITRDTIMTLARDNGMTVVEQDVPRESLYIADEVFFTGTAAEVTPVRSVDKIQVGAGRPGPITQALQKAFFQVVNCEVPDTHGWLTWVYPEEAARRQPLQAAAGTGR
jgi:branched-chain amino acid aminotransferase